MDKEFVPYDESLALKSLGFNEPCFGCHEEIENRDYKVILEVTKSIGINTLNGIRNYNQEDGVSAPTFSQAFRWFREQQEWPIDSWIRHFISQQPRSYGVFIWTRGQIIQAGVFSTYDEAQLNLLRKLIEIVKTKQ